MSYKLGGVLYKIGGDHFSLFGDSEFTVDGLGEERRGVKRGVNGR